MAWISCAGLATLAALAGVIVGEANGVAALLPKLAILVGGVGSVVVACFLVPGQQILRTPLSFAQVNPHRRADLRHSIAQVAKLQVLTAAALPGPIADHLAELEACADHQLTLIVNQATMTELGLEFDWDQLVTGLDGLVTAASRLAEAQQQAAVSRTDVMIRRTESLTAAYLITSSLTDLSPDVERGSLRPDQLASE